MDKSLQVLAKCFLSKCCSFRMWKQLLARGRQIWGVSLGAGLLGAVVLTLRYALRPSAKPKLPDAISPAIFATRIFYTSRGQLVYHESGQGAPLVFLHGVYVGASSYEWSKVYPHFAGTHQVLAVDLLGFGESERPDVPLSAADHVRALVEFIRAKSGGERAVDCCQRPRCRICNDSGRAASGSGPAIDSLDADGRVEFGRRRLPKRYGLFSRVPIVNRTFYRRYLSTRIQIRAWLKNFAICRTLKKLLMKQSRCSQTAPSNSEPIEQFFSGCRGRFDLDLEKRLAELSQPVTLVWGENAVISATWNRAIVCSRSPNNVAWWFCRTQDCSRRLNRRCKLLRRS